MGLDMEVIEIEGVKIVPLKEIFDPKGSVLHFVKPDNSDIKQFGECYLSEIHPGVVKAWKLHTKQEQNFAVPIGKIQIVLYDARENSKSAGKLMNLNLGRPEHYFRLKIPHGVIYGFKCISEQTAFVLNLTDTPHDPLEGKRIEWDDPMIPFRWI